MRSRTSTYSFNSLISILLFVGIIMLGACTSSPKKQESIPSFSPYIAAYTGGMVSATSPIKVILANDLSQVIINEESNQKLFSFSPSLKGKTIWRSSREVEFIPDSNALKPNTVYEATFDLSKILEVDKTHAAFNFMFQTIEQNFSFTTNLYQPIGSSNEWNSIAGQILLADKANITDVRKMISIDAGKQKPTVIVAGDNFGTSFNFTIDSIQRTNQQEDITIKLNGASIGKDKKEQQTVSIPALGTFKLLASAYKPDETPYVELSFSDLLDPSQDLKDLITIAGVGQTMYQTEKNSVRVYFQTIPYNQELNITIAKALRNSNGKQLPEAVQTILNAGSNLPQVALLNKGNIMPNSDNLILPFKAVNLKAVDLSIVKVYENNILRFLQSNNLEGTNDLRMAGRLVLRKVLPLTGDGSLNLTNWNEFSVDLAPLIKQDPGAIYRVELTFRKEYANIPCVDNNAILSDGLIPLNGDNGITEEDQAYWDQTYGYYSPVVYNWNEYRWEDRNNPCTPTYYMNADRFAGCNILSSNLGILAEAGANNDYFVVVNNLLTTAPEKDVKVDLYNFQLQPIGSGTTDENGFVNIPTKGMKPFVLAARKDKERGYLKLDDASALSFSRFDVSGKEITKGLRGYIYTERGVWRPGDSIFLSFILNDKANPLPKNHPVVFEMYTPTGGFYKKMVETTNVNGFYTFKVATEPNAPTGRWESYVKVGGAIFSKPLRIEAIKPNRLKINLNPGTELLEASKKTQPMSLQSSWLLGLPASDLKATVEMKLTADANPFKQHKGYNFVNPTSNFVAISQPLFEGTLNAEGNVRFDAKLPAIPSAPGLLQASFISRVYEEGGDFSTYVQTGTYAPFTSYAGVQVRNFTDNTPLVTDTKNYIDIMTVSPQGNPVSSNVEVVIYKLDWRWWWEKDNGSLANYMNSVNKQIIQSQTVATQNGKASVSFDIKYPNWGRYLVYVKDTNSGHATAQVFYIDWPASQGQAFLSDPEGATMLTFTTDKDTYKVGEQIKVTLPQASSGRALVTIENGSSILQKQWVATEAGKPTLFNIEVTPEMAPNVYIHVTLLQPHGQKVNDLPIRLYGIKPIAVENQKTHLEPQIEMADMLKPQKPFNVTISEKTGTAMTYTLAIVDEGLLDLTAFRTPNPWTEFYTREALGVRTWDLYNYVMGAYGGTLTPLLSVGGDEELRNTSRNKANRFKPVVRFMGPFTLAKGKKATHQIELPAYVGAVRVMVVAGSEAGAYGNASKSVEVKNSVMTLSSLPRMVAPDDNIYLPVNLFVTDKAISSATVSVATSNGLLQLEGNATQQVSVKAPEDKVIFFKLKAGKKTGVETVTITSKANGDTFTETIELDVRNANLPVTIVESKTIPTSGQASLTWQFPEGSDNGSVKVDVSRIPGVNLTGRLAYLTNYPFGCAEQIISQAFPQLYLSSLVALTPHNKEQIKQAVLEAIRQMNRLQLPDGGIRYWSSANTASAWVTSYAGAFMYEAKQKGYDVSNDWITKWKTYQKQAIRSWNGNDALNQAYRLYTMALYNEPETGAMNRLRETNLDETSRWMLAYTYALLGKNDIAMSLIDPAQINTTRNSSFSSDFGSPLRDESVALMTLSQLGRMTEALPVAQRIATQLSSDQEYSTQATAFGLMAMAQYAEKLGNGIIQFDWTIDKAKQPAVQTVVPVWQTNVEKPKASGTINIESKSETVLFAQVINTYTPLFDKAPAVNNGLTMNVSYRYQDGTAANIQSMMQGTPFTQVVEITNSSATTNYTNLALTSVFAAGWENLNTRFAGVDTPSGNYTYRDIRDDRVSTFFDLKAGETKRFTIHLQAAYAGTFYLPAIQCEAMYESGVQARNTATEISIVRE